MFGFQQLDVYRCAVKFLGFATPLSDKMPRGYAALGDQLRRAALSVPLNIAEGNGRLQGNATQHYSIARGSALECAAILDACEAIGIVSMAELASGRELLERIVSMLTKMAMR
jgi:four helix bundle protein